MRQVLHVISDLHLGGSPAVEGKGGFQICTPASQDLLASWIDRLPASSSTCLSRLLIAGDIVDFLAEEPFEAFTADVDVASAKLAHIFDRTDVVWAALRRFATDRQGRLSLMIGNHDIELSLPGVRERLLQHLGGGPIEFIIDNEAFTLGPVLVEHGNRFDPWNAVPHGALRRARSQLSRRRPVAPAFPAMPGSRLVIEVMNPLKKAHPFIDLLKPEDAGALPLAAALGGIGIADAWRFFVQFRKKHSIDYDEDGEPQDESLIAAQRDPDAQAYALAMSILHGGDVQDMGAIRERVAGARHETVFQALRACRALHRRAFDIGHEEETYLVPARAAARAGFRVIVYGHTHLAKQLRLEKADHNAVYLNTGTWADLMGVPDGLWHEDPAVGRATFASFAGDLGTNALTRWRRPVPTYARIELDDEKLVEVGVFFADTGEPLSTDGLLRRVLAAPAVDAHPPDA